MLPTDLAEKSADGVVAMDAGYIRIQTPSEFDHVHTRGDYKRTSIAVKRACYRHMPYIAYLGMFGYQIWQPREKWLLGVAPCDSSDT